MTTVNRRAPSDRDGTGIQGLPADKVPADTFTTPDTDLVAEPARGVSSFEQQAAFFDGVPTDCGRAGAVRAVAARVPSGCPDCWQVACSRTGTEFAAEQQGRLVAWLLPKTLPS
jgi:hypothetical protein